MRMDCMQCDMGVIMETFSELCGGIKEVGFIEKPKYDDGTSAWIGDYFEKDGHEYKIYSIEYRMDRIVVFGRNSDEHNNAYIRLFTGETLAKPKTKLEKIKDKLLEIEWTREQAVRACELIAEAFELGKEVGKRGN